LGFSRPENWDTGIEPPRSAGAKNENAGRDQRRG
jgi:hypothetical protein